ncbi:restriction endonuclease subunit S [Bacillus cereus group sp. BfR-BA-01383]|uniref:restriction endonuclease subunit S n=1 Tax=Bacillus cereus group sp. BfR-BA-01383 TaxID=2920327 RepID=UPI001F5AC6E3|nr:restriction endonuclease subunit S [Bacillus cereus group sp. BfR-BA-01383]
MEYIKLKDAFTIKKGKKVEVIAEYQENSIRCIQIGDLRNDDTLKYCLPNEKHVMVGKEDVLIAWDGANAGTVGIGLVGALGSTLAKLSLNTDKLLAEFVAILLQSKFDYFQQTATGATIPHISRKALEDILLPVIDIEIQKKIVKVIYNSLELINQRQSQLAALDELKQSVFLEMFGDPTVNKDNYVIRSLMDFYISEKESVKCGPFGSALKKEEYTSSGIPVWNMDNITKQNEFIDEPHLFVDREKANQLKNYKVENGDIIISRAGTVGKMAVVHSVNEESLISTNLIRLRLNDELVPEYLVWLIKIFGDRVCRMKTGNDGAFTHMNTSVLNSIEFPVPPLEKQVEFLESLRKIELQKSRLLQGLSENENLKKSLLQKALKGELFQNKA